MAASARVRVGWAMVTWEAQEIQRAATSHRLQETISSLQKFVELQIKSDLLPQASSSARLIFGKVHITPGVSQSQYGIVALLRNCNVEFGESFGLTRSHKPNLVFRLLLKQLFGYSLHFKIKKGQPYIKACTS